jgi:hypothetical protein
MGKLFLPAILFFGCFSQLRAQEVKDSAIEVKDSLRWAKDRAVKPPARVLATVTIRPNTTLIRRQLDKTVVNIAQSITSEGSTVLEAMQRLPGVQVGSDGQVTINGKSGVNVYIDGKPTYLSAADLASLLNGMPASSIQRIEIMTNPSSKYDASGTSGIINIVKKKNHKAGSSGTVNGSAGMGHFGKYNGGVGLSYKNERVNLFLNDSYTYNKTLFNRKVTSDLLNLDQSLLTEQVSDNNNIHTERTDRPTAGMDWQLSQKTTISLSGTAGISTSNDRTVSVLDRMDGNKVTVNHEDFTSATRDRPLNYTTTIQLARQLDTLGGELTLDLDHSLYKNDPDQHNRATLMNTGGNFISETDVLLLQKRRLAICSVKADYTRPWKDGRLEAGMKSSYVKAENDNSYYDLVNGQTVVVNGQPMVVNGQAIADTAQSDYSVNTERINAVYVDATRSFKRITGQAGLRVEQTKTRATEILTGQTLIQDYLQLFPTLFLQYRAGEGNSFILRAGRRTERPAYSEMVSFRRPLTPTLYFQGNPNLRPHLSWHQEISWVWKEAFTITIGYDLDHDYIQTLPYPDSNKATITRRPTNVQAHSWNADLGYSKKLTGWWSTDNTLSLYRNSFTGEAGGYLLKDPGMASLYVSLNNSFRIREDLSAEVDWVYNSERRLVTSRFGPYSVLNAGVKRMLWEGRGSLSLNAHNILQSEGHNVIDRYSGLDQYSYFNFYTRSVSLSFLYRFGSGKPAKRSVRSGSEEEQQRAGN